MSIYLRRVQLLNVLGWSVCQGGTQCYLIFVLFNCKFLQDTTNCDSIVLDSVYVF